MVFFFLCVCLLMVVFHASEEVTEQHVGHRPALKIAREERRENEASDGNQTDGRGETHLPVSLTEEEQEGQISAVITHTITVPRADVDYKPACLSQEVLPYGCLVQRYNRWLVYLHLQERGEK